MYYELYIDVFFLENFMLDSLILLILNRIMNNGRPYVRPVFGGILGSFLTCLVIIIPLPSVIRIILFHTTVNSVMLCAGLKITRPTQFVQAFLLLYVVSAVLGGTMQIFRPYMRYVGLFYTIAVAAGVMFLQIWKLVSHMHRQKNRILRVTLYTDHGEKQVNALFDTGNELRDWYTGEPVNIIDPETAAVISERVESENGFRLVPYRCVSGEALMKVFRVKKMCVHMEDDRWVEKPLLGIGEEGLSGNREYEMILNPAIFSG